MFRDTRGNSIIEVIVVIVILSAGIIGTYGILSSGQKLSTTSENRIRAINIAREGLEAVENIRDTNWIKFSSDYDNCWRVQDYNVNCIGNSVTTLTWFNVLVQSGSLWSLSGAVTGTGAPVYIDANGLTSHSGSNILCGPGKTTDCKTIFSRWITISYPDSDHMKVKSVVTWTDSSKDWVYTIDLETILTNWKKKF